MRIIPVLDVQNGHAVHAVAGDRDSYRPLQSRFAPGSSDPGLIARGLRDAGASELYLADLDAITRRAAPSWELIAALDELGLRPWVDVGVLDDSGVVADLLDAGVGVVVVGLETVGGPAALGRILARTGAERVAVSLDLRDGVPIVAPGSTWDGDRRDEGNIRDQVVAAGVARVIRLDLARVGTGRGIDHMPPVDPRSGVEWLAGGGVAGPDDLERLAALGYAGALVGSALHDGRIADRAGPLDRSDPSGHRTS